MKYEYKGNVYAVNFEIIDQEIPNILGLQACVEMNLVQRLDAINMQFPGLLQRCV